MSRPSFLRIPRSLRIKDVVVIAIALTPIALFASVTSFRPIFRRSFRPIFNLSPEHSTTPLESNLTAAARAPWKPFLGQPQSAAINSNISLTVIPQVHAPGPKANLREPTHSAELAGNSGQDASEHHLQPWERRYLGWEKYRSWMRDSIQLCSGDWSNVSCARLPEHTPRRAYFCYGTNIEMTSHKTWVAHCNTVHLSRAELVGLLQDCDPNNPLSTGALELVQEPASATSLGIPSRASLGLAHQPASSVGAKLTYLATGDCNTGNPGHCMADPHNFYVVRTLLGIARNQSEVLLLSGFGKNRYLEGQNVSEGIAWKEDWRVFADDVKEPAQISAETYPRNLQVAAWGALGMHGPHWRAFKDNHTQQGRSEILLSIFKEHQRYMLHTYNLSPNPPHGPGSTSNLTVLWIQRGTKHRTITNEAEVTSVLVGMRGVVAVNTVDMGKRSYLDQYRAVAGASVVVGMHGGAMWNAARWMSAERHQKLLEIMPQKGPGATCALAKMMGILYLAVQCFACKGIEPGRLEPSTVIAGMQQLVAQGATQDDLVPDCRLVRR